MADTSVQGSFAFRCRAVEADLLEEAMTALADIGNDQRPDPPSAPMLVAFPSERADGLWSGLVETMPDPDFPCISADFSRETAPDDPTVAVVCLSCTVDFEPLSIAELIRVCCHQTLKECPVGFTWAMTCSRPRLDEFSGGWCAISADRIEIENSGEALSRALRDVELKPS